MINSFLKSDNSNLFLLGLVSILLIVPLFIFGIPNGIDLPQHYQFALTFQNSLQNGHFYPSWSNMPNFGFGDIGIRFYPPFSYYVLVVFQWITGSWFYTSILTFWFWFFISGTGAYLWAKEWFSNRASLIAAIVYVLAPYHVNQIYNAFTYAEFAAASIVPFCFLFITRICRNGKLSDVLWLAFFYALLILTHLPMTVIGSLSLAIYSLFSLPRKDVYSTCLKVSGSVSLGLLLSAFYWVRMVSELDFVNHATQQFTSDAYDFHSNFLAGFLYVSAAEYDERTLWFGDLVLIITLGFIVPCAAIFYLNIKSSFKPKLLAVFALFVFSVFMSTPLSLPVWENLGVLQKVQFPWRWLAIISLSGTIFTAAGFEYLDVTFRTKLRPLAIMTIGLVVAAIIFTFSQIIKPAIFISHEEFNKKIESLSSSESYECWWTIWAKKEALSNQEKVSVTERNVSIKSWNETERSFLITEGESQNVRIATFYYPYWQATVNNIPVIIENDENGVILVPVPKEESLVKVYFQEPLSVKIASIVSIFSWSSLFGFILFLFYKRFYKVKLVS